MTRPRCLWCGLFDDECNLSAAFGRVLCADCAPKDPEPLEAAMRTFHPWPEGAAEEALALDPCSTCGTSAARRPTRASRYTGVEICVPCLLTGLTTGSFERHRVDAAADRYAPRLDASRERVLNIRKLTDGPFEPITYEKVITAERKAAFSSLTFSGALYDLAKRIKLQRTNPVTLTGIEVMAGLRANLNTMSNAPAALAAATTELLDHVVRLSQSNEPESADPTLLSFIIATAVVAHAELARAARTQLRTLIVTLTADKELPAEVTVDAELEENARNPYIAGWDGRCAAYALLLLRDA